MSSLNQIVPEHNQVIYKVRKNLYFLEESESILRASVNC